MMAGKAFAETTVRGTVLATFKQPVTTLRQGLVVFWHRPREIVMGNMPVEMIPAEELPAAPGTEAFEKLLDEKGFPRPEAGALKWLVDGEEFFPEVERQIAWAKKSINIQLYIFDNDDIGVRYADILKKRSMEVPVRVLYDDFGTASAHLSAPLTPQPKGFQPPADMDEYLEEGSKVKVRMTLNPWLVADHTKLLLFDYRTGILGGMNLGREYYNEWHDLMVRVEGPVVAKLSHIFEKGWKHAGPMGDLTMLVRDRSFSRPASVAGEIPIRVLRTEAVNGKHEIRDASLMAIRGAKRRIYIENPYFASDEVIAAVRAAAVRGVDVRVVLPAEGDSAIMDIGNLATARVLIEAGAKLYRYPRMTHMKVMICDDWATVGSANLDILSMRINSELNISFSDKAEVEKLVNKVFRPDFAVSKRIRLRDTESATAGFAEAVADQL